MSGYLWRNTLLRDDVDPSQPLTLNQLLGRSDGQIWDPGNPVGTETMRPGQQVSAATPLQGEIPPGVSANDAYARTIDQRTGGLTPEAQARLDNPMLGFDTGGIAGGGLLGAIKAYHGSPHGFDAFDASKIGTGEGKQAYGHGLYFAENEGVARGYRDALTPKIPVADPALALEDARGLVKDYRGDFDAALKANTEMWNDPNGAYAKEVANILQYWRENGMSSLPQPLPPPVQPQGHMYEVNLNAEPEHFLDWDKPLSEQHPVAREALSSLGVPDAPYMTGKMAHDWLARGATVENNATRKEAAAIAAQRLQNAGIPGIRYLDAGSRSTGEGSRNYVTFNDSIIDLVRRYGIAGLIGAGAGSQWGNGNQQQ
jgi:hypothetical protein